MKIVDVVIGGGAQSVEIEAPLWPERRRERDY
jgi:hypothetical protein